MAEPLEHIVADDDELTLAVAFAMRQADLMDADSLRFLLDEQRVVSTVTLCRLIRANRSLSTEDAGQMAVIAARLPATRLDGATHTGRAVDTPHGHDRTSKGRSRRRGGGSSVNELVVRWWTSGAAINLIRCCAGAQTKGPQC